MSVSLQLTAEVATRPLRARVTRDIEQGLLSPQTDPAALSGLVMAVTQGMSVMARDGADRDELLRIVAALLAGWPRNGTGK